MADKSYGEAVLEYLKDKRVEVYTGSSAKEREYADFSVTHKEVVRGILRDAMGDLLVVEVTDTKGNTNTVFINCWFVTVIIEPKNGISIVDVYCDEYEKQVK